MLSLIEEVYEDEELVRYKIYCDLDGVLCNFEKRFLDLFGVTVKEFEEKYDKTALWKKIGTAGEQYWSGMEWTPRGRELWNYIKKYNPVILTSPSRSKDSKTGKTKWVQQNLSEKVKVEFRPSKDKKDFADVGSILIDDRDTPNLAGWRANKGISIHCPTNTEDISNIIKQLQALGL